MRLSTNSKQQMLIHIYIKYQKLYLNKIKLLSKLLVCLLAISYNTVVAKSNLAKSSIQHSATKTCLFSIGSYSKPSCIVKLDSIISHKDLNKGTVTIDPVNIKLEHVSGLTHYKTANIFETGYISHYAGSGGIDKKSSIYFGLTPAKHRSDYQLAVFMYEDSLTIDTNKLSKRLSKDTLKSIVICTEVSATNLAQGALYIKGYETITTLTDGLIIANSAHLKANDDPQAGGRAGLAFKASTNATMKGIKFKADIINYGMISGYYGVIINAASPDSYFCLRPTDGGKTARFYNHGQVIAAGKAFKIMGKKCKKVDTFELINKSDGIIQGGLQLVESSDPKKTIKFNVVNYNKIKITTDLAHESVHITNYTGKIFSKLVFVFESSVLQASGSIAHFNEGLHLEKYAKIVLEDNHGLLIPNPRHVIIAETAPGGINLAQGSYMIVTPVAYSNNHMNNIISAATISITDSTIEATLTSITVSPPRDKLQPYMPKYVPVVNAYRNIMAASQTAITISKRVKDSKYEIAGINLKTFIPDFKKAEILHDIATEYCSSADDFFDILLPDSSNSQLISNHAITNKLVTHVSSRLNSKMMTAVKAGSHCLEIDNQGFTSGEIIDNISVWTAFNYFQNKTKGNKDKQSYNNFKAMIVSLGIDSDLEYKDTIVGLSYGFCRGSNKVIGGSSDKQLSKIAPGIYDEEDLKTHTVILYSAMNISPINVQAAFSFGATKHIPKTGVNLKDYNSRVIGVNFAITYPFQIKNFNIDVTSGLGVNIINTAEHEGKYNYLKNNTEKIEKDSKALASLSLIITINDIATINDDIELDYRFGVGSKYTISDNQLSTIVIENQAYNEPTSIYYKKRQVGPFNFNIDTSLNFQIHHSTHLGLDLNLEMGKDSFGVALAASLRYMF